MSDQIILSWTQIKNSTPSIELEYRTCRSYLIVEVLERIQKMGYHIDCIVPVLLDKGVALSLANIIISKPPVRPVGPG